MTKVKDNIITTGLSGKLGKQIVFRQWDGSTFLTKAPVRSDKASLTEGQERTRLRFRQASAFAKKILEDPEMKKVYLSKCKPRQNTYTRAIQDFFTAPVIHEMEIVSDQASSGNQIRVYATDDFMVKRVEIQISDGSGSVIESGSAVREADTNWWVYSTTVMSTGDGKITAYAYDLPGNEAVSELAI